MCCGSVMVQPANSKRSRFLYALRPWRNLVVGNRRARVVLHRATVLEEVHLDIVAPDHLEAVEDTLCHVEVRVVNRGTSLATVRFAIAHEAPKIVDISKGGEASYAVALAMTLELRYVTLIVEAKGSDGTFAPVQGGTSDPNYRDTTSG